MPFSVFYGTPPMANPNDKRAKGAFSGARVNPTAANIRVPVVPTTIEQQPPVGAGSGGFTPSLSPGSVSAQAGVQPGSRPGWNGTPTFPQAPQQPQAPSPQAPAANVAPQQQQAPSPQAPQAPQQAPMQPQGMPQSPAMGIMQNPSHANIDPFGMAQPQAPSALPFSPSYGVPLQAPAAPPSTGVQENLDVQNRMTNAVDRDTDAGIARTGAVGQIGTGTHAEQAAGLRNAGANEAQIKDMIGVGGIVPGQGQREFGPGGINAGTLVGQRDNLQGSGIGGGRRNEIAPEGASEDERRRVRERNLENAVGIDAQGNPISQHQLIKQRNINAGSERVDRQQAKQKRNDLLRAASFAGTSGDTQSMAALVAQAGQVNQPRTGGAGALDRLKKRGAGTTGDSAANIQKLKNQGAEAVANIEAKTAEQAQKAVNQQNESKRNADLDKTAKEAGEMTSQEIKEFEANKVELTAASTSLSELRANKNGLVGTALTTAITAAETRLKKAQDRTQTFLDKIAREGTVRNQAARDRGNQRNKKPIKTKAPTAPAAKPLRGKGGQIPVDITNMPDEDFNKLKKGTIIIKDGVQGKVG